MLRSISKEQGAEGLELVETASVIWHNRIICHIEFFFFYICHRCHISQICPNLNGSLRIERAAPRGYGMAEVAASISALISATAVQLLRAGSETKVLSGKGSDNDLTVSL